MRKPILICTAVLLSGCGGNVSIDYHTDSNSIGATAIVNSKTETTRSSMHSENGWERRFDATGSPIFANGKLVKWDPNAVIKLREKKSGVTQEGEYRAEGTKLTLYMKHGAKFEPANASEEKWAKDLLASFHLDDTPEADKEKALMNELAAQSMSVEQQKAVVDKTFSKLNDRDLQVRVLQKLIARADFKRDTGHYLMDNIGKVHYEKDQRIIQRALMDKEYK